MRLKKTGTGMITDLCGNDMNRSCEELIMSQKSCVGSLADDQARKLPSFSMSCVVVNISININTNDNIGIGPRVGVGVGLQRAHHSLPV